MQRRVFLLLGLLLAAPLVAQANTISLQGSGLLAAETPNQTLTLVISGPDSYSDSNFRSTISAGGPGISAVFGDNLTAIPVGSLASSVWVNGFGGIAGAPNGTTLDSTGRALEVSFGTAGFGSVNTQGIYAVFTVSTVGIAGGTYILDMTGTDLFNGLDENGDPIAVPLQFGPITLTVPAVPEPSSVVLGLFAAAGMAAVVIRRRRAA